MLMWRLSVWRWLSLYILILFSASFSEVMGAAGAAGPFTAFSKDSLIREPAIDSQMWDTVYTDVPFKSPFKVAVESAVLPGLGQLDNGKKLKAFGFFISESLLLYGIVDNNIKYNDTGDRDYLQKRKDFTWILALTHLYGILDAVTDAYLYRFDEIMADKGKVDLWKEKNIYMVSLSWSF